MITFTPFGSGLLIYTALLSAVSFVLWYYGLKYNKACEISIYKFLIPVFGAILLAILIPEETMNWFIVIALVLVVTDIITVNIKSIIR
ncbi:EamA family transporter [Oceanobacillus rekensis]|uniref:EamA family transporter n=1 Tax=Oceanobacillus rekensis TaxID=937927 RepID=UPI001FE8E5EF|nr:EamA family transporter [Oceanobacillus rekensis]